MKSHGSATRLFDRLQTIRRRFLPRTDHPYFDFASERPFIAAARGFDPANAAWLADAAMLAYVRDDDFIADRLRRAGAIHAAFLRSPGDGLHDTRVFVARFADFVIVAFKGTEPDIATEPMGVKNLLTDLRFATRGLAGAGFVHEGFISAVEQIAIELETTVEAAVGGDRAAVWFAGHSLGGALATLASFRRRDSAGLYTFGSPRVGDGGFRDAFRAPAWRVVHGEDFVTLLPPKKLMPWRIYRHVGKFIHLSRGGRMSDDIEIWNRMKRVGWRTRRWISRVARPGFLDRPSRRIPIGLRAVLSPIDDHAPIHYARKTRGLLRS
jgi:hypothetical protein